MMPFSWGDTLFIFLVCLLIAGLVALSNHFTKKRKP